MSWWQDLEAENFEWTVPEQFNIAHACVDVQNPDDLALVVDTGGHWSRYTFGEVATTSRKFATVLADLGLVSGDRVGVMVPQGIEVLATHLGAFRSGMVTVPLSVKFGSDAVVHRMRDSGAKVLVVDKDCYERVADGIGEIPGIEAVIVVGKTDQPPIRPPFDFSISTASSTVPQKARNWRRRAPIHTPSSSIPRERRGIRKAPSTGTEFSWRTCPVCGRHSTMRRSGETSSGRRQTGPGSAVCSTFCFQPLRWGAPWLRRPTNSHRRVRPRF
ncbi:hypothetical protein N601_17520 [Rhodococcus erythropolis DN1]|nr:hypothetical protein N601_17520 [Rhodococcus erythropolis DN1]